MKRFWLIAALLLMVGCTNDEATEDTRDLVDDAENGVEDLVDDAERDVDDIDKNTEEDNVTGDGTGPITDNPSDINGDGQPDVNGGVNGNGGTVDENTNMNGKDGPNENEAVNEGITNDRELQENKKE